MVIADRAAPEKTGAVVSAIASSGGKAHVRRTDVSVEDDVLDLFAGQCISPNGGAVML